MSLIAQPLRKGGEEETIRLHDWFTRLIAFNNNSFQINIAEAIFNKKYQRAIHKNNSYRI